MGGASTTIDLSITEIRPEIFKRESLDTATRKSYNFLLISNASYGNPRLIDLRLSYQQHTGLWQKFRKGSRVKPHRRLSRRERLHPNRRKGTLRPKPSTPAAAESSGRSFGATWASTS